MSATAESGLRVLIAGGGSGGHVIPALAIADELRDRHGAEVCFVGTARGFETRLVPKAGYPLELVRVGQLKGQSLLTRARTLLDLPLAVRDCLRLLRSFQPHAVVGVGGYASGPGMLAALLRRIPTLAYEPNAFPGLANRLVGRRVTAAAIGFDRAARYFRNAEVVGITVRRGFFNLPPRPAGADPHLLIFGGSQGARIFNTLMPQIASALLSAVPGLTILHQSGANAFEATSAAYAASGADPARWQVHAFLDDMPGRFAAADLVLSRSGASSVAELAAAGKPALLVPFPLAADDHQRFNAQVVEAAGGAKMLLEPGLDGSQLLAALTDLFADRDRLARMALAARTMSRPDAAERTAEMVVRIAGG